MRGFWHLLSLAPAISAGREIRRRCYHAVIHAGNWIYIDGGDVSYQQASAYPENLTLGIDLSRNWTNSSLNLVETARSDGSMPLNQETLWWSETRSVIYRYGGEVSTAGGTGPVDLGVRVASVPSESIWQFTPDGHGGGEWTEALGPTGRAPFPPSIIGTARGASVSDAGHGYYIGGYSSLGTTRVFGHLPWGTSRQQPGLQTFDFGSLTLSNTTDGGFFASQYRNESAIFDPGNMVFVPWAGVKGIVLVLGGSGQSTPASVSDFDPGVGEFVNISIYDLSTQSWLWQTATGAFGAPPMPRASFCAVGAQGGDNSTYEIFIHGGIINNILGPSNVGADEIYILSLPSFQWFKVDYPSLYPRAGHKCVSTGTSQMAVIGGLDPTEVQYALWDAYNGSADPWVNGLGVFDMRSLQWKSSYEANAGPYAPADMIKQYYNNANGTRFPSSWSLPAVQALFENNTTTSPPRPSAPSSAPSPSHNKKHVVIGTVLGCAAATILIIAGLLLFRHRTKQAPTDGATLAQGALPKPAKSPPSLEMHTVERPSELPGERARAELAADGRPMELDAHQQL